MQHVAALCLTVKPRSHRARRRIQSKLMLKIGCIYTDRVDARASTNLHISNERRQFKLYIGYWTSNNNKWPKCSCRYRTPSPDNTLRHWQWRNWQLDEYALYYLQVGQITVDARVDATRRVRCEWGFNIQYRATLRGLHAWKTLDCRVVRVVNRDRLVPPFHCPPSCFGWSPTLGPKRRETDVVNASLAAISKHNGHGDL